MAEVAENGGETKGEGGQLRKVVAHGFTQSHTLLLNADCDCQQLLELITSTFGIRKKVQEQQEQFKHKKAKFE